jgi:predicted amidohydrolase YtcJ
MSARAAVVALAMFGVCENGAFAGEALALQAEAHTPQESGASAPADLVVLNGKVLTVDPAFSVAEAVAIRGGTIVLVGTTEAARRLVGKGTRVIDAGGNSVVPGLIDSHVHALGVAEGEAKAPFRDLRSVAEIQDWVRAEAGRIPAGRWIWTPRLYPPRLRERRFPTKAELDEAAPRHPVVVDGAYALTLNTAALAAAGIDASTPSPEGGAIVKDARGQPTGLLRNVGRLLAKYQPQGSATFPLDLLERVHRGYASVGITSVVERGADVAGYRAYAQLRETGRLKLRATVTLRVASDGSVEGTERFVRSLPVRFGEGDDRLKVGPLKLVADGGILIGTAFMRKPYGRGAERLFAVDDPAYRGFLTLTPEKIRNIVRTGHRLGWQMCAHVTGDAGVDAVLDAVLAADADAPIRDRRFTLIHAYFTNAAAAARAARLGVCVDTQPAWYYKDAAALASGLGEERLRPFIGLAEWLRAGVTVAINTDHMFGLDPNTALNPYNPFLTMYVAVTRKTEGGRVIGAEQAVSRADALRMMTRDAAYLSFDEKNKGSLEVGKLGDLVVLSHDFMACPPERLKEIGALATVVGGEVVYQAPASR